MYVSRGRLRVKINFIEKSKKCFLSALGQKTLCFSHQKVPWTTLKNALFPCRLTLSMKWYPWEKFHFRCLLDFEREDSGRVVKKWSTLTEEQLRKLVVTSNDLILDIVFWGWTSLLGFWPKNFNRDVNTAISASRWTTSGERSFFRMNYQFQFILALCGRRVRTFNEKKTGVSDLHLTCPEAKLDGKKFFVLVTSLHICSDCDQKTFKISSKKSLVGSPNCLVHIQMKGSNEVTFFRNFEFHFFSRPWAEKIRQCCQTLIPRVQKNLWRMRF